MSYTPFLISDFQTGKDIGKEPWLSTVDAFPTLINAQVNKGVLEKRKGYSLFAQMKHGAVAQTTTSIMGIFSQIRRGLPTLLICDTKRVNKYNAVDGTMTDIASSDIFTGSDKDFFHSANWLSNCYFTNNVNRIQKFDGVTLTTPDFPIDTATSGNQINTCRFIFVKSDRILFLDTVESGTWYPNRCRYGGVLAANFVEGGYTDAPTDERMVAAEWVGKDIGVWFENSFWKLKTYGETNLPFKWEKVTSTDGCLSPYAAAELKDGIATIGIANILYYDGFQLKDLDIPKLRDIVSEFKVANLRYIHAFNSKETRHVYFTYTSLTGSLPDRVLDYNVNENNWSVHKINAHCLGGFNGQKVPIWTEADSAYRNLSHPDSTTIVSQMTVDSRAVLGNPYPYTLFGGRDSKVYKLNDGNFDGTDDAAGNIELDVQSARWNPFIKDGRKATLGRIDFLVDNDATASATISLFKDHATSAYTTKTLSCTGSGDKFWTTMSADGETGDFHRMKISHTARSNRPRIHAIMLYMKPAGRLYGN